MCVDIYVNDATPHMLLDKHGIVFTWFYVLNLCTKNVLVFNIWIGDPWKKSLMILKYSA